MSPKLQPLIGILTYIGNDYTTTTYRPYIEVIEKSGGIPLVIPYLQTPSTINYLVDICDGIFYTGGDDVNPERYGEKPKPYCGKMETLRDELEFFIFNRAFKHKKPILGVCRGTQVINVALGGTLYQDIPTERPSNVKHRQVEKVTEPSHSVNIKKGTPLHALIGNLTMQANSFHHQSIKTLGKSLLTMATADDEIIESVYYDGNQYIRGYQWHPERLYDIIKDNRLLFDDFVNACISYAKVKSQK